MFPDTSPVRRRVARRRALAGLFAGAVAATAGVAIAVTVPQANAGSIPAATQFYTDPNSQVIRWVAQNPNDSRRPLIQQRIASQPQGIWIANYRPNTVTADVQAITGPAASQNKVPVLVAYMLPNRDCGGASAGGAPTIGEYNTWVQRFAAGLGNRPVIIILEPDSIALITCLDANALSQRYSALGQAARTIKAANPQAKVYFDGGHSGWNPAAEQANRLRSAGVANGDGVYTNVSNFHFTDREKTHVKAILNNLGNGNLRGVIDTSRNGRGALGSEWCDPAGRGIGANPTADTFDAQIDAYLWVKPPGEADGCATTAGTFLPDLAYTLAQNGVPATGPTSQPTMPTGSRFRGEASGRCLDVNGGNSANGTQALIWDCHTGANQQFSQNGQELKVLGKCLDAPPNAGAGTRVQIWDCSGGANQRWNLNSNGTISNAQTGLCLDVNGAATANGSAVIVWSCHSGANQRWARV